MVYRLRLGAVLMLCLLPLAFAGFEISWVPPWRQAELGACAGDFVLPSGLFLPVRREGNDLRVGAGRWTLRRAAPFLYVGKRKTIRLRFKPNERGNVDIVEVSGVGPAAVATRARQSESDTARTVDVGGHVMRLNVVGREHDGPTVILETGPLGSLEGVALWQADVAKFARVVAYDHPGTGGSEQGPRPQTASVVMAQLREALSALSLEPPYVVAGMSMGGPYSQVFADRYPSDVHGLVWIDPTPDWQHLYAWCDEHAPQRTAKIKRSMRWMDLSVETRLRKSPEGGRRDAWSALEQTWMEVRQVSLPDVPIIQITGAEDYPQRELATLKVNYFNAWLEEHAAKARHVLALHSQHGVYGTEPELVLEAIRSLVEAN